jgi:transcriptional antiterminator, bglG
MWEKLDDRKSLMLTALEQNNVSIIDLSNALSVSEKTIKKEIQILNHQLKDGAYIYLKNGIVSLFIYNFEIYNYLKDNSVVSTNDFTNQKFRILYIINRLLNSQNLQLDFLAEDMSISKSTLIKDIKLANDGLIQYELNIIGKPNVGISLIGKEIDKRYFIIENTYEYINKKAEYEEKYNEFLYNLFIPLFINEATYKSIIKFFHVSLYRLRNKNKLETDIYKDSIIDNSEYKSIYEKIKTYVYKTESLKLSDEELNFILIPLLGMRTSSHIKYKFDEHQIKEIEHLTQEIFKRIKDEMDINVDLGEVTENFTYHIFYLLNRINLNYKIKNPLSENIKNEYKVAYKMSEIAAHVIYEQKQKRINESEKSYLASYFQIYLFDKLNSSLINRFKIAIINRNKEEAIKIIPFIQDRFSNIYLIDYYRNFLEIDLIEDYDLIISSYPLNNENVLYLPNDTTNTQLIQKELDDFYFKQNIFKKERVLKSLIFTELRESTLYIGGGSDYDSNLVEILDYLEKQNIITEDFTNAILLRESESSTTFSDQVAFPHIKNDNFILSLGIFPYSNIKVVFIVGIPNDDDTLIINLYDEIVSLSTDKDFFDVVVKARDYRQLMELIIKETELFR